MHEPTPGEWEIALFHQLIALANLCASGNAQDWACETFKAAIDKVAARAWSDEEHRVIFACLRDVGCVGGERLRNELAAQATRYGHPDVDWDIYFPPTSRNTG